MAERYYLHKIYTLLLEAVSDAELRIFCYDQPGCQRIYAELTADVGHEGLLDRLVAAAQASATLETILAWVEQSHPESYQRYGPYAFTVAGGDGTLIHAPYRGLFAFREEDAPVFFGRETITQRLVKAVENQPLVAVIGPSGSGKSSVIFAGLVPHLRSEAGWLVAQFRPGNQPFQALATALLPLYDRDLTETDRLIETRKLMEALNQQTLPLPDIMNRIQGKAPTGCRLLLIADQFEELYTLCPEAETRRRFLDMLLGGLTGGLTEAPSFLTLVLSLRADFLGQALAYRPLADALQDADVKLGPMTPEELRQAVEKPANQQGVVFESGLVERILDDVGDEPGNLPLLEFALTELWDQQVRGQLTHGAYEAIGQVVGALTRYADEVYAQLSPTEQTQAQRVFTQMVRPGLGTEDTRRLATLTELGEAQWRLVQKLADVRLVVTNRAAGEQDTVEVVHEALIRHWQQLREWVEKDRDFRTWQERLRFAMGEWLVDRDEDMLLRGVPLAEAEGWLTKRQADLSPAEQSFIQASLAERRRQENQRRWLLIGVAVTAVVMTVLALFSLFQWQDANRQRAVAIEQQSIAEAAEATAVVDRNEAQAAKSTAEVIADTLADQNAKSQAEVTFYQTTDPAERLGALSTLFSRPDADSRARARSLFFGLPRVSQLSLLQVAAQPDELATVGQAILPNLADINGIYYTDQYLTALQETITDPGLQTELQGWLTAREAAGTAAYDQALAYYDDLLAVNDQNPALWYERARIHAKLGQMAEALADMDQVMALAQAPEFYKSGELSVGTEFANADQMAQAVRQLLLVYPALADAFEAAGDDYPALAMAKFARPTVMADNKGVPMVQVPAGTFNMGSNAGDSDEQPIHTVYLDEFYIDQYEVTNGQYQACEQDGACQVPGCLETYNNPGLADHPVVCVNWDQAQSYCAWRGAQLPTEAQWEKAARGTDERSYPWGEEIAGHLARYWNDGSGEEGTVPVGHYPEGVGPYGAYDMAGNVWEWVADWYDSDYYRNSSPRNPTGPEDGENISFKVLRGGSWSDNDDNARAPARIVNVPDIQIDNFGFRCARSAPE